MQGTTTSKTTLDACGGTAVTNPLTAVKKTNANAPTVNCPSDSGLATSGLFDVAITCSYSPHSSTSCSVASIAAIELPGTYNVTYTVKAAEADWYFVSIDSTASTVGKLVKVRVANARRGDALQNSQTSSRPERASLVAAVVVHFAAYQAMVRHAHTHTDAAPILSSPLLSSPLLSSDRGEHQLTTPALTLAPRSLATPAAPLSCLSAVRHLQLRHPRLLRHLLRQCNHPLRLHYHCQPRHRVHDGQDGWRRSHCVRYDVH